VDLVEQGRNFLDFVDSVHSHCLVLELNGIAGQKNRIEVAKSFTPSPEVKSWNEEITSNVRRHPAAIRFFNGP
jgi:hypothetical protein